MFLVSLITSNLNIFTTTKQYYYFCKADFIVVFAGMVKEHSKQTFFFFVLKLVFIVKC